MRIRLAPCLVKEIREFEGSYYLVIDAPNETLKAVVRPDVPQAHEMVTQLQELNAAFMTVDLEASVRAYLSKASGQQIEVLSIQVRPPGANGTGEAAGAKK
jgi:hypothetical protein